MAKQTDVSFVIPCLNEEQTLARAIELAEQAGNKMVGPFEIVISDNGSTDRSVEIARELGARIVRVPEKGYGNALLHGIQQARGKYIVMGDADATYLFKETVPFVEALRRRKADMVMGSRLKGRIEADAMPFLHRYLGTPVLSLLIRFLFKVNISDCNCGLRAFTKDAFEKMNLISGGMEFASEMIIKAGLLKLKIIEMPCSLLVDKRNKAPHLKTWRDGWRHLKFILMFAPKALFLFPGIFLFLLGAFLSILLSIGEVKVGPFIFNSYFMVLSAFPLMMGYQLIWLYEFDRYFISFTGYMNLEVKETFHLDRYLLFSLFLFIIGMTVCVILGLDWIKNKNSTLPLIRLFILGIDILFISLFTALNAFMVSMMDIKIQGKGK